MLPGPRRLLELAEQRWEGAPETWAAAVAKEEHLIDRAVAEQLVLLDEVRQFMARQSTVEPVTVDDVAAEFEVPREVAREACRRAS